MFRKTASYLSALLLAVVRHGDPVRLHMSDLRITQAIAEWIGGLEMRRWWLMVGINVFLLVLGCFLPPAAIILMTTPILMSPAGWRA